MQRKSHATHPKISPEQQPDENFDASENIKGKVGIPILVKDGDQYYVGYSKNDPEKEGGVVLLRWEDFAAMTPYSASKALQASDYHRKLGKFIFSSFYSVKSYLDKTSTEKKKREQATPDDLRGLNDELASLHATLKKNLAEIQEKIDWAAAKPQRGEEEHKSFFTGAEGSSSASGPQVTPVKTGSSFYFETSPNSGNFLQARKPTAYRSIDFFVRSAPISPVTMAGTKATPDGAASEPLAKRAKLENQSNVVEDQSKVVEDQSKGLPPPQDTASWDCEGGPDKAQEALQRMLDEGQGKTAASAGWPALTQPQLDFFTISGDFF